MAVSQENKRIIVTLTKEKYEELAKLSENENRTMSNMAATMILEGIKARQEELK